MPSLIMPTLVLAREATADADADADADRAAKRPRYPSENNDDAVDVEDPAPIIAALAAMATSSTHDIHLASRSNRGRVVSERGFSSSSLDRDESAASPTSLAAAVDNSGGGGSDANDADERADFDGMVAVSSSSLDRNDTIAAVEAAHSSRGLTPEWPNASAPDDAVDPALPTMPRAVLVRILQYVDGRGGYRPDILAFERTCRSFRNLLGDDAIWGQLFPHECEGYEFEHTPTMRERAFLKRSLYAIMQHKMTTNNILLECLGGACGVRRVVGLLLDEMNPLGDKPPLYLRGDAIEYLVEVIQGHMITRLEKTLLMVVENLRPGDGYPEISSKHLCLMDFLTSTGHSNTLQHCSIAHGSHTCKMYCFHNPADSVPGLDDFTWPDHNCDDEEILSAEERRKMVRALAYRAGVAKMSGAAFSIIATEILHHMAVIVSRVYVSCSGTHQPDCDENELRMNAGLSYFANFHPPGETDLVIIPRQIKDAAVMIGMKPILGFGCFGCEWAASSEDGKYEEVDDAEARYFTDDESESEDGSKSDDKSAPEPEPDEESNVSLLSESFSLDNDG